MNSGTRPLGIPTVADRVAQEVARRFLQPGLEPAFHADSYGYRPGRSAHDAVRTARERCWRHDWVLDLDIKGFFDSIDWELLLKAVRHHTDRPWVLLYIERWLKAPVKMEDGSVVPRTAGTPQGGVISPLLANLSALRVRHVDGADICAHQVRALRGRHHLSLRKRRRGAGTTERTCRSPCGLQADLASREDEDRRLQRCKSAWRFSERIVRLPRLHIPGEENDLARAYPCARLHARGKSGGAESHRPDSRRWALHHRSDKSLRDLAAMYNPASAVGSTTTVTSITRSCVDPDEDRCLAGCWARRKFKRLRHRTRGSRDWFVRLRRATPTLFAHWQRRDGSGRTSGARVNREVHARFWERAEVQFFRRELDDFVEEVGEQFEVNQPVIRGTPIASR